MQQRLIVNALHVINFVLTCTWKTIYLYHIFYKILDYIQYYVILNYIIIIII